MLAVGALAGCASLPPPSPQQTAGAAIETIWLVARGWHTDLALPEQDLPPALAGLQRAFPGARTLLIGFGERTYLLTPHPGPIAALAALLPNPGALLVSGLSTTPEAAFPAADVVTLRISPAGMAALGRFLTAAFAQSDGALHQIKPGPYPGSAFYPATPTYSGMFTCNTWSAEGLAQAGLPVQVSGVLFAGEIRGQARRIAAAQRNGPGRP